MNMERYLGDIGDIIGNDAIWRVSRHCRCREGENLVMDSFHVQIGFWRVLVEILSNLPRPMARRRQYPSSWRADERSDGGSGELSGDDLARSHGLVLPRSREFGDKVWCSKCGDGTS
ncbi:hypothetical protein Acr_15g0002900 [Actinidia rufa]|uniref:Uncharacterized protein n=1 Tax=Actinidia rufa TaxID=165716 RepID=A0A7J0FSM6_9ERIC|nr:hypothetical protein Acr_15g0002900 [Actinidia rufa]